MLMRQLGAGGPDVSVVGLGTNNFGRRIALDATRAVVDAALDEGITLFDTADIYGDTQSESLLGEVLEGRRDRVVLLTKFGAALPNGPDIARGSRAYVRWAVDNSLQRLRTDRIDVYMYHLPDGVTPFDETMGALGEVVDAGKVRFVGISNVDVAQIEEAAEGARAAGAPLVCVENHYSLVNRDAEHDVVPACMRLGLGLLPYSPLESGLLTGKYRRGEPPPEGSRLADPRFPTERWLSDEAFDKAEALERYAAERNASLLDVAIGGLAAMPAVGSVIAGATRPEQVRANVRAGAWVPSAGDLAALHSLF